MKMKTYKYTKRTDLILDLMPNLHGKATTESGPGISVDFTHHPQGM